MLIAVASLHLDFQASECLFDETLQRYISDFQAGRVVDPVEVYSDGKTYWLFDGFHRVAAVTALGIREIEAVVTRGTYDDMEARWRVGLAEIRRGLRQQEGGKHFRVKGEQGEEERPTEC